MEQFIIPAAQLGGTVFVTVAFLFYLSKKDSHLTASLTKWSDSQVVLARALQRLTDTVEKNSIKIAENTEVTDKNTNGKNGTHTP